MPNIRKTVLCPDCGVEFSGPATSNPNGRTTQGRTCPKGHWNPYSKFSAKIAVSDNQMPMAPQPTRMEMLRQIGALTGADATHMSLVTMLECYERAVATAPHGTFARAVIDGAFGKAPEVARRALGVA